MASTLDMVHRRALGPDRTEDVSALKPDTRAWLKKTGFTVKSEDMWHAALTHGSMGETHDYQRLEFLGDRVLGLSIAHWLFDQSEAPEGKLAQRLNAIVSRETCAAVARRTGLSDHIRISKQARADGGQDSDNILGDVMESLLAAQFLDNGFVQSFDLVQILWRPALESGAGESKHPKSALQEWAAGNRRKPPEYTVIDRSGPDHAAQFTVRVSVHKVGEAEAIGNSKGEAEKAAAKTFMKKFA